MTEEADVYQIVETPIYKDRAALACIDLTDAAPSSRKTYVKAMKAYFRFLAESGRDGWDRSDVIAFKDSMKKAELSPSTINLRISTLRTLYDAVGKPEIMKKVKIEKQSQKPKRDALTLEQTRILLASVEGTKPEDVRDRAILNLMARTGLRAVEVSRADVGDIRTMAGHLVLKVQGKGHTTKDDEVKLSTAAYEAITEYLKLRPEVSDDSPLFISYSIRNRGGRISPGGISDIVKDRMTKAGIKSKKLSGHSLRHTVATTIVMNGGDIYKVKETLRHSSIKTSDLYVNMVRRFDNCGEDIVDAALGGVE